MSQEKLFQYAAEAKQFMQEAGEGLVRDELIMRAAVAYGMLERRGMLASDGLSGDARASPRLADDDDRRWSRAHAIALIAHNFEDHPPSTPDRAMLFGHVIET